MNHPLKEEDVRIFYSILSEEIADYDCGLLCRSPESSIPYCCTTRHVVPLLYRTELSYLKNRGDLWNVWEPVQERDRDLLKMVPSHQVFSECRSGSGCHRLLRSISCRTFPLEPYIDLYGNFSGLTFIRDFTDKDPETGAIKCPLTARKGEIRQEFIDTVYDFWERMLSILPEEYATYQETSEFLRREFEKTGRRFHLLVPSHLIDPDRNLEHLYQE